MAKYPMVCIREIYEPAKPIVMEFRSLVTGELVDTRTYPGTEYRVRAGEHCTARTKAEVKSMLNSGNWKEL